MRRFTLFLFLLFPLAALAAEKPALVCSLDSTGRMAITPDLPKGTAYEWFEPQAAGKASCWIGLTWIDGDGRPKAAGYTLPFVWRDGGPTPVPPIPIPPTPPPTPPNPPPIPPPEPIAYAYCYAVVLTNPDADSPAVGEVKKYLADNAKGLYRAYDVRLLDDASSPQALRDYKAVLGSQAAPAIVLLGLAADKATAVKRLYVGPLPATVAELQALLAKHKGASQ